MTTKDLINTKGWKLYEKWLPTIPEYEEIFWASIHNGNNKFETELFIYGSGHMPEFPFEALEGSLRRFVREKTNYKVVNSGHDSNANLYVGYGQRKDNSHHFTKGSNTDQQALIAILYEILKDME